MFLTPEEIAVLTECTRPSAQRRHLARLGIPFKVGAKGRPKVLRTVALAVMGGLGQSDDSPKLRLPA